MLVSVIIPAYNEEKSLEKLLGLVFAVPVEKEVIVINDASRDKTGEIADHIVHIYQSNRAAYPYVTDARIIHKEKNAGKGAAIRTGLEQVTGDVVLIQDADLELDPGEYPKLLEPIEKFHADVVFGSRFRMEGIKRTYHTWHYIVNRVFTTFSNLLSGLYLTDMWTCYKVFRTPVIKSFVIESNRFGIEPELVAKVAKGDYVVYEVGVSYHARSRKQGKKIGITDALEAVWLIIKFNLFR